MYLHYATVVGDFERVVEHWIMEEEWTKAIDVINRQVSMPPWLHVQLLTVMSSSLTLSCTIALRPSSCVKHPKRLSTHGYASAHWTPFASYLLCYDSSTLLGTLCHPTMPCVI